MFGIGLNEMIIITVIALIVIGPKQLPEVARMLGKLIANFKRATSDLRTAIADEVDSQADLSAIKEMKSVVDSELYDAHHTTQSLFEEGVEEAEKEAEEAEEKVAKEEVTKEEVAETGKVAATEKKEAPAKLPYDDSGAAASGMPTPPGPTGLEEEQELAGPPPEKDEPASRSRKTTAS